jgi:hypothetical protein
MREKITEKAKTSFSDTIEELKRLEISYADRDSKAAIHVTEVENEVEALRKELEAFKRGKPSDHKGKPKNIKSSGPIQCYYCKKKGHFQKDCFKRQKENGAYKDKDGKPFVRRVREAEDQNQNQTPAVGYEDDPYAYATTEFDYNVDSLNWQ